MNTTLVHQEIELLEKNIVHIQHDLEEMNNRIVLLKHGSTMRKKKAVQGDKQLISLVGTQPIHSVQQDKILLREAIEQCYRL